MFIAEQKLLTAIEFHKTGDLKTAEELYLEVLSFDSCNPDALYFMAVISLQKNQKPEALRFLQKYLEIDDNLECLKLAADISFDLGLFDVSAGFYKKYFIVENNDLTSLQNLGISLLEINEAEEAVSVFEKIISMRCDSSDYFNCALAFCRMGNLKKAEEFYLKSYELSPENYQICLNLAALYYDQFELDKAINFNKVAISNNPECAESYNNLGNCYLDLNDTENALKYYNEAVRLSSGHDRYRYNLARAYFTSGDTDKGWDYFKYRNVIFGRKNLSVPHIVDFNRDITDKTVFVYYEAGFGDVVQFARYVNVLKNKCKKVIFQVQDALVPLFRHSFKGVEIIGEKDVVGEYDIHTNVMSLPFVLDDEKIPFADGYLDCCKDKQAYFKEKYFNTDKKKIGIVWHSKNHHVRDMIKSIPHVDEFKQLLAIDEFKFYSFQVGRGVEQLNGTDIVDLSQEFKSFDDTAAALKCLDLLISVDTAVAHLAGALGVPVWLLLSFSSNWRWFLDRQDSPYYSDMKLFRQPVQGDWESVIKDVCRVINPC